CMDAILVGIGTVRADDPLLTARPPGPRAPVRIVLDSRGSLPADCQLVRTAREVPVLVATAGPVVRAEELRALGCEVLPLPAADGRTDVPAVLGELGRRRMTNLLVEGGSSVLGSFLDAQEIDEVHVYISPRLAGGADARTPIGGRGVERLAEAIKLSEWQVEI